MKISAGSRWKSAACATEVVVVKPPRADGSLACGGLEMLDQKQERPVGGAPAADRAAGTLLGKRYGDDDSGIELLCTKGGHGSLSFDGRDLPMRSVKPLPSSD